MIDSASSAIRTRGIACVVLLIAGCGSTAGKSDGGGKGGNAGATSGDAAAKDVADGRNTGGAGGQLGSGGQVGGGGMAGTGGLVGTGGLGSGGQTGSGGRSGNGGQTSNGGQLGSGGGGVDAQADTASDGPSGIRYDLAPPDLRADGARDAAIVDGPVSGVDGGALDAGATDPCPGDACTAPPITCGDFVETDVLARWSAGSEDSTVTTLSVLDAGSSLVGAKALRAVTQSGFDFWLRYTPAGGTLAATETDELRFAIRGLNTTPIGWQGNFPVVVIEDATSARRTYTPSSQLLNSDGAAWMPVKVPLGGGTGWQVTGSVVDFGRIAAIEVHADTWDSGFTLDLDGMSVEKASTLCACPVTCSQHGQCAPDSFGCLCDLGYGSANCASCAEGFVAQAGGACGLAVDGTSDVWPNAFSKANSDPWIVVHHDEIAQVRPKVLALNFANPNNQPQALLDEIFAAFSEASRPQGYRTASASAQLDYQLVKIVDLRDGVDGRPAVAANYPYDNSTLYPATGTRPLSYSGSPPDFGSFDYGMLFTSAFAKWYGFPDAANPGQYLDLCTLVERGEIHDLWVIASGDKPDAGAAEVLETKPLYTVTGNRKPGSSERCAGNGCFESTVPFCGRSLRIGLVNYNRGPGCFMESLSHGLESAMNHKVAPAITEWFPRFAGFDLDARYGLPFTSWYGLGCASPPCLSYPTQSSVKIATPSLSRTIDPFDAVCGNVHYPPNGRQDYDINDAATVRSSCADFGLHSGAGGSDALSAVKSSDWMTPYGSLASDCDGPFLVWWWQNMPAHGAGKTFSDGSAMKSVWPFLYY